MALFCIVGEHDPLYEAQFGRFTSQGALGIGDAAAS